MNWNQLQYVLTLAEEKSITRAAQKLYLTQPSLSLSLKSLEAELGTPLFTRGPEGLELTYAGGLFCAWAEETLASFGRLNDKLTDIVSGRRQLLRLGVSPHRGDLLLPAILSRFYRQFPNCEVHTIELSTTLLLRQLEEKQLDFIVDVPNPDTVTYCNELLLNVLRNRLYLTGAKYGCGIAECGACTVIKDGKSILSCMVMRLEFMKMHTAVMIFRA